MSHYLSRCVWVFASFLAPSAAASTLTSAAAEVALLMPLPPPKAGEDMASQVALHSAGRRLTANQKNVSDVSSLKSALIDSTIDHIYLAPNTYTLSEALPTITRSVKIEADPGTVVLDAGASSSSRRRVLKIDAENMAVEIVGLNITGGFVGERTAYIGGDHVSAPARASRLRGARLSRAPMDRLQKSKSLPYCCRVPACTSAKAR